MKSQVMFDQLHELGEELRQHFRREFDRSLSFQDMVFDRWERARSLGFGEGTSIYQDALVIGDVAVGERTWIGPYTILDGSGGLSIGHNCSISSGVQIYTHDTVQRRLTDGKIKPERAPTSIGNSCYIGPLTIITKNVTVGHHSVVGANSLLTVDLEPYSVAIGTPARRRGKVTILESGRAVLDIEPSAESLRIKELEERLERAELLLESMRRERQ